MDVFSRDVCVIGGAGHVGLPLALTFADCGPAHRHLRHRPRKRRDDPPRRQMPFAEEGGPEMLARVLTAGRSKSTIRPEPLSECRFLVLIIGTPVDEHLNPSFTGIQRALDDMPRPPARRADPDPPQHGLPRHQRAHSALPRPTRTEDPRRLLPGARGAGLQPSASSASCRRSSARSTRETLERGARLFGRLQPRVRRDDADGGRALQADDQLLALHSVRDRQPVLHDRDAARRWTSTASCTAAATSTRAWRACPGPGFAAGPCLVKDTMQLAAFSQNQFMLGHSAMLINEGLPATSVELAKRQWRSLETDGGHPRHGVQGRERRPSRFAELQAAQAARRSNPPGAVHRPLCSRRLVRLGRTLLAAADVIFIGAAHDVYRDLAIPAGKQVFDVSGCVRNARTTRPTR